MIPASSCKNEETACSLGLSETGSLLIAKDGSRWEAFDFNAQYSGYYPSCRFTAIACCGGIFYAAAVAEDGLPWVFSSLMGGVWEPVNLIPASADGAIRRPTGKVLRILYDSDENQVFLVCENGELVTLPDCPRCVKIRRVADKKVADGRIDGEGKEIVMLSCDGTEYRLPTKEAVQYRASIEYIGRQLDKGGFLVDVRDRYTSESEPVENSVRVPLEELPEWLETLPRSTALAFFCTMGTRSDRAAEYARRKGFARAYSIGGLREISVELCKLSNRRP